MKQSNTAAFPPRLSLLPVARKDVAASPAFTKMLRVLCSLSLPPSLLPLLGLFCKENPTHSPPVTPHPPSGSSAAVLLSPAQPSAHVGTQGRVMGLMRDLRETSQRIFEPSLSRCRGGSACGQGEQDAHRPGDRRESTPLRAGPLAVREGRRCHQKGRQSSAIPQQTRTRWANGSNRCPSNSLLPPSRPRLFFPNGRDGSSRVSSLFHSASHNHPPSCYEFSN